MPSTSATDGFQLREAIHSHRILRGKGLRRLLPVGTLAGLVLVLVTSVSALRLSGQSENPLRESQKSATGAGVISLDFRPLPMEELKIGEPQDHWLKAKTVEFCAVRKVKDGDRRQERAIIHLFIDANDKGVDRADVYAFLDDHSTLYDLGNVSAYGVTGVQVDTADLTNWETKEIVLSGGLGAACGFAEVLGFHPEKKFWVHLLTMYGIPKRVAAYGDNWVIFENSPGGLPPWLNVYRWLNGHFEQARVVQSTGDQGACFITDTGSIRTESYDASGQVVQSRYWRYEAGKLIPTDAAKRNFLFRRNLFGR